MTQVRCSVSNCEYWDSGNYCSADAIMIDIDKHSQANYDTEFAEESLPVSHKDKAKNSAHTCCHTFKPKYE